MSYLRDFERITITRIVVREGMGTPDDLVREVTYYVSDDGELIGLRDPVHPSRATGEGEGWTRA
jgi:predicted amidohydrolase